MNLGKYNSSTFRKPTPLPIKQLLCSLCSFTTRIGPNDLQVHLDTKHRGWADVIVKKITVGRDSVRSSNAVNLRNLAGRSSVEGTQVAQTGAAL